MQAISCVDAFKNLYFFWIKCTYFQYFVYSYLHWNLSTFKNNYAKKKSYVLKQNVFLLTTRIDMNVISYVKI